MMLSPMLPLVQENINNNFPLASLPYDWTNDSDNDWLEILINDN